MNCNTCYFSAIFRCSHPKRYAQSFIEDCELYREGDEKIVIDNTVQCRECGKFIDINDVAVFGKGSTFLCGECIK